MESLFANPAENDLKKVNEIIASFLVSLKNFGLYAEDHDICQNSIRNAFNRLEGFLETTENLRIDIDNDRILYQNETIFQDSEHTGLIAYYLFRDGIKWISFSSGLTIDQLKGFLEILDTYRTLHEDPEGDLATALWEANFQNISYKASDIYWESEPSMDFTLPVSGSAPTVQEGTTVQEQKNSLIQAFQNPKSDLFQLTPEDTARLKEMIMEEEKRDSAQDLLELASIILSDSENKDLLEALFHFVKNEIRSAVTKGRFESACRTLLTVHKIRSAAKTDSPWAIPQLNRLIISISDPEYLDAFSIVLRTMDKTNKAQLNLLGQFFLMLHTNALQGLAPMMGDIRSISVRKQLMKILVVLAARNLNHFEKLLNHPDENVVQWLVDVAGHLPDEKAIRILRQMTTHPSAKVRRQAMKCLLTLDPASLEALFPAIEDSSEDVRQIIFSYLKRQKNEVGEKLLLDYLRKGEFTIPDQDHILNCYRALGLCGSPKAIPFLEQVLFKSPWRRIANKPIHRQGAVSALMALKTQETRTILSKASRSFSPAVRMAYKRGKEETYC